jgi:hypothetical protein
MSSLTLLNVWSHHSQWVIATLIGLLVHRLFSHASKGGLSKPPGPHSLPLIGNIWRLNPARAWLELTRLKEKHGMGRLY